MNLYISENKNHIGSRDFAGYCIADFLETKSDLIDIKFNENYFGKPFVENLAVNCVNISSPVYFSLSHSGDRLICTVAHFNVGADIQKVNLRYERCKPIALRFFNVSENYALSGLPDEKSYVDTFFTIWVRKEAYIKYTGKGFAETLRNFSVFNPVNVKYIDIEGINHYKLAICVDKEIKNEVNIIYV